MTTAVSTTLRQAPGPRGTPLIGVIPAIRRDTLSFLMATFRTYGDVAHYRIGPLNSYLISHPDGLRRILQEHVRNYTKDHVSYSILRRVAGNGLVTSQGDFWLRQRRLAQPAFHRQRIAALGEMIVARSESVAERWAQAAAAASIVTIGEEMMGLTLQIVGNALFGTDMHAELAGVHDNFNLLSKQLVERFRTMNLLPPLLPTRYDRAWRHATAALDRVVYSIIAQRRSQGGDHGDLLSMLMLTEDADTGERMDDTQLRDEILTMLVAGHETTATTLTWAWGLLAAHPEIAAKLQAELDTVLGARAPTMADLPNLRYTRMVIDEVLRLYPPIYILSRKVIADDAIGGYRIPAGSATDFSPYVTHRHPAFWDDPERFDPERFTPERVATRHKFAYIPFSSGPRMCIGNSFALTEATLILAHLARRFAPALPDGKLPAALPLITLRPAGDMAMRMALR
ncbi:MAG: cytochrome P450 [Oscillochloris sp.]|nr:cytochrome P450 [Oscillochloris sp.]